jgi:hypothetical protein
MRAPKSPSTNARWPRVFLDYGKTRFGLARPFGQASGPSQRGGVALNVMP